MYTQTTHVSSVHQFSKPRQSKKWTLGGSVSLLFFFFSLAQQRMFAVSVPDFKVSINCVIFRMCKAACLNAENQTKLCKKNPLICAILYLFFLCKCLFCMYIFAIQMQLECVHMKMWYYVGISMQWYILSPRKKS